LQKKAAQRRQPDLVSPPPLLPTRRPTGLAVKKYEGQINSLQELARKETQGFCLGSGELFCWAAQSLLFLQGQDGDLPYDGNDKRLAKANDFAYRAAWLLPACRAANSSHQQIVQLLEAAGLEGTLLSERRGLLSERRGQQLGERLDKIEARIREVRGDLYRCLHARNNVGENKKGGGTKRGNEQDSHGHCSALYLQSLRDEMDDEWAAMLVEHLDPLMFV